MNYIEKVNEFWAVQSVSDEIGPKEIALYFWVLNVANRLKWPVAFSISTQKACAMLGFTSRSTFSRSRDRLIQCGLLSVESQTGSASASYSFEKCDTNRTRTESQTATPIYSKTNRKTERVDEQPPPLSFSEMLTEAKTCYPDRTDIDEVAEKLKEWTRHNGSTITLTRLKQWIEQERHPRYRKKPRPKVPDEPSGWKTALKRRYGNEPMISWSVFYKKYPEDAHDLILDCDTKLGTNCDTIRDTSGDAA